MIPSKGTTLEVEIATVWTVIEQLLSFEGPGLDPGEYRGTTLDQPGRFEQWKPTGYVDGGQLQGEIFYDPKSAIHKQLLDFLAEEDPIDRNFRLVFSDGEPWAFPGHIRGFAPVGTLDDGVKARITVRVSGDIVFPV